MEICLCCGKPKRPKGYCGVVSPPYQENKGSRADHLLFNPKYNSEKCGMGRWCSVDKDYGNNPSNIGNLPDKPMLAGIVSPPYANPRSTTQEYDDKYDLRRPEGIKWGRESFRGRYSENPDNIGHLKDSCLVGITSPPYESADNMFHDIEWMNKVRPRPSNPDIISQVENNIEKDRGESYLQAMFKVYSEAYRSGISPLILTTKNPTRGGALRRLDLDTISILQKVGYEIFDYHRSILFTEQTQGTLDGATFTKPKGRMSFFKRLSYQKGNAVAKWEDIIFARIPNRQGNMTGIISPPYSDAIKGDSYEATRRRVVEGKYKGQRPDAFTSETNIAAHGAFDGYSKSKDNIGNLPDKPLLGIVSPPYSEAQTGGGIAIEGYRGKHINEMGKNQPDKVGDRCGYMKARHGNSLANIGNLPDKEIKP